MDFDKKMIFKLKSRLGRVHQLISKYNHCYNNRNSASLLVFVRTAFIMSGTEESVKNNVIVRILMQ